MTFKGQDSVVTTHAFAIVGDLQQASTAGFDIDDDARRAGVDSILDELFGDGCRPLNHFAGSDQVGNMIREYPDFRHYNFQLAAETAETAEDTEETLRV